MYPIPCPFPNWCLSKGMNVVPHTFACSGVQPRQFSSRPAQLVALTPHAVDTGKDRMYLQSHVCFCFFLLSCVLSELRLQLFLLFLIFAPPPAYPQRFYLKILKFNSLLPHPSRGYLPACIFNLSYSKLLRYLLFPPGQRIPRPIRRNLGKTIFVPTACHQV